MTTRPELVLKPHVSGLLLTAVLMGAAAYYVTVGLLFFVPDMLWTMAFDELLVVSVLVVPLCIGVVVTCVAGLLDVLRTAMTGLRPSWQVRITHEGIHHPLVSRHIIRWDDVEDIFQSNGLNGKDIWFTLSPGVWQMGLINVFVSLIARKRVSYLRILCHRFQIDSRPFMQALHDIVPARLQSHVRVV